MTEGGETRKIVFSGDVGNTGLPLIGAPLTVDEADYKDSTQKRLMDVVRQTMAGEHIFPDAPPTVEIGMAKSTEFTKTELKVLRHLLRGLSYTHIAAEMGCEMSTVKFHVANMLQKTGLENKLQLALAVSDVKLIADLAEE